ncbi:MAG: dTDP-4-dehydrorhamnose 3,5-epimerase [Bacteroidales bacterium]|nr:dTDP-4-dehydrorhamnose 3,5-epimerase [Bacteroidales bacterium]
MKLLRTDIDDVLIIEPELHDDSRGYFVESFNQREFDAAVSSVTGLELRFVQDNESLSSFGVMRGLHFQLPPFAQSKLVRCVMGCVVDVAVDIRRGSPTYGRYVAVELSQSNHRQILIPKGFAHGFAVMSREALFQYKCDEYYHPEAECGLDLLDPVLGIDWKMPIQDAVLSDKDRKWKSFADFDTPFEYKKTDIR